MEGNLLARKDGDLLLVDAGEVEYVDISLEADRWYLRVADPLP